MGIRDNRYDRPGNPSFALVYACNSEGIVEQEIFSIWIFHLAMEELTLLCRRWSILLKKVAVFHQPPQSHILVRCDFILFPKLKENLKENPFDTVTNAQEALTRGLHACWKKRSVTILNIGNNAGFPVSMPKMPISRNTKGICNLICSVYFKHLFSLPLESTL